MLGKTRAKASLTLAILGVGGLFMSVPAIEPDASKTIIASSQQPVGACASLCAGEPPAMQTSSRDGQP
jgi:hypothetical protein